MMDNNDDDDDDDDDVKSSKPDSSITMDSGNCRNKFLIE